MRLFSKVMLCVVLKTSLFGLWAPPLQISISGQSVDQPQVAVDAQGNATAVWEATIGARVFIQSSSKFINLPWQTPVALSDSSGDSEFPKVAVTKLGEANVVWEQVSGTDTLIRATTRPLGANWSSPVFISSVGSASHNPEVAVDDAGNTTAVWYAETGATTQVQAAQKAPGISLWSLPPDDLGTPDNFSPNVAMQSTGNAVAIWSYLSGGNYFVQASTKTLIGPWLAAATLSQASTADEGQQVVISPNGFALAVWGFNDGSQKSVQIATEPFGGNWTLPTTISVAGFDAESPRACIDMHGNAYIVWKQNTGSGWRVAFTMLPFGGNFSPVTYLSPSAVLIESLSISCSPQGLATAAWAASDGTGETVFASVYAPQLGWSPVTQLSVSGDIALHVRVSVDDLGNPTIVWLQEDGLDSSIMATQGTFLYPPQPARNFHGRAARNRFTTQTEYFNELWWEPGLDATILGYYLFRNGQLIGQFPPQGPLHFVDHRRPPHHQDTYTLVSFNPSGILSAPVSIVIVSKS